MDNSDITLMIRTIKNSLEKYIKSTEKNEKHLDVIYKSLNILYDSSKERLGEPT